MPLCEIYRNTNNIKNTLHSDKTHKSTVAMKSVSKCAARYQPTEQKYTYELRSPKQPYNNVLYMQT